MEPISCWPPEEETTDEEQQPAPTKSTGTSERRSEEVGEGLDRPACSADYDTHKKRTIQQNQTSTNKAGVCVSTEPPTKRCKDDTRREHSFANVALARWWKTAGRFLIPSSEIGPGGQNPITLLRYITRHPEGQAFLRSEISRLTRVTDASGAAGRTHAVLATFLERTGQLEAAMDRISTALEIDPAGQEIEWLYHRIKIQLRVKVEQTRLLAEMHMTPDGDTIKENVKRPESQEVERVSARQLSVEEFQKQYAETRTPVIITDLVVTMTTHPWDIEHVKDVAGSTRVQLRKLVPGSANWAQLECAESTNVATFIDSLSDQELKSTEDKRYLFDLSLPIHFPDLAKEICIPKYFSDNFLTKTAPGTLYRESWPSLFVAPKGIRSELHVDAFGSNFWMALFQGRKRWVFFNKNDLAKLYPIYESALTTDPTFEVNIGDPDYTKHPLFRTAESMECILQPGELLFVPAGCPHYVENMEKSLAISANFVNHSNMELVQAELNVNRLLDERAYELLCQLRKITDNTSAST